MSKDEEERKDSAASLEEGSDAADSGLISEAGDEGVVPEALGAGSSASARSSRLRPVLFGLAAVAAVALVVVLVVNLVKRDTSAPGVTSEPEVTSTIQTMVDRYNAADVGYIKNNSCGELKIRSENDLGGLMDLNGSGAKSPGRYEIVDVGDFQYFSEAKNAAQIYANAEIKYPGNATSVNYVGYFSLLRDSGSGKWKVCTAYLMSIFAKNE